ncbi:MAG TPA: hypothetical protein VK027_03395 [Chitinophagaceae bacterium]|nr:hypothetical protein [Chitinophagaceae bacterium]
MRKKITAEEFYSWFQEELQVEKQLTGKENFRDLPKWSSLNALILMTQTLEKWNVILTADDLSNCVTVEDIWKKITH